MIRWSEWKVRNVKEVRKGEFSNDDGKKLGDMMTF